jgi:hypothetical protein
MELERMHHTRRYQIEVEEVDVKAFNAMSPLEVAVAGKGPGGTVLQVCTDQAGLIGLLLHLHQQGHLVFSFSAKVKEHAHGQ